MTSKPIELDTELFELCKSVYEKTEWIPTDFIGLDDKPIYNLGDLLDNLPLYIKAVNGKTRLTIRTKLERDRDPVIGLWQAMYGHNYSERSDSPLKALLKLTIALHEAGELPTKKENK